MLVAFAVPAAVLVGGTARAAQGTHGDALVRFVGCVALSDGTLRLETTATPCGSAERRIEWAQLNRVAPTFIQRACVVDRRTGQLRFIAPKGLCRAGERTVRWSQLVGFGDADDIHVCVWIRPVVDEWSAGIRPAGRPSTVACGIPAPSLAEAASARPVRRVLPVPEA